MKKQIPIVLTVVVLAAIGLFVSLDFSSSSTDTDIALDSHDQEDVFAGEEEDAGKMGIDEGEVDKGRQDTDFRKIDDLINKMAENPWNVETYNDISSQINAWGTRDILDTTDTKLLTNKLNLYYIGTLREIIKSKFGSSNSTARDLTVLQPEVNRYYDRGNGVYAANVRDISLALSNFGNLLEQQKKAKNSAGLEESELAETLQKIRQLAQRPYLKKSPLVKTIVEESTYQLIAAIARLRVDPLQAAIQEYVTNEPYNTATSQGFLKQLDAVLVHPELKSFERIPQRCDAMQNDLHTLYEHETNFERDMPYQLAETCEKIYTKFQHYYKRCEAAKIDTTGTYR